MTFTETAPSAQAKLIAIKSTLAAAADFRQAMAAKYPRDGRNLLAAQLLQSLSSDDAPLPDHLTAQINAAHGLAGVARDISRKVGFSVFPELLAELIQTILLRAAEQQEEIWRVFPNGGAR